MSADLPKGWQPDRPDELRRLTEALERAAGMADRDNSLRSAGRVETIYRLRRRRAECFPTAVHLFHDPAWEILTHLFLNDEQPIAAAAVAGGSSAGVGLRWIRALQEAGLVACRDDPDGECVRITEAAIAMMDRYLAVFADGSIMPAGDDPPAA